MPNYKTVALRTILKINHKCLSLASILTAFGVSRQYFITVAYKSIKQATTSNLTMSISINLISNNDDNKIQIPQTFSNAPIIGPQSYHKYRIFLNKSRP